MICIEYLNILTCDDILIVEIKRTDLPRNSALDEIYFWLVLDKASQKITRLHFVAMESRSKGREERFFENAELFFNDAKGSINIKDKGTYQLRNCTKEASIESFHEEFVSFVISLLTHSG